MGLCRACDPPWVALPCHGRAWCAAKERWWQQLPAHPACWQLCGSVPKPQTTLILIAAGSYPASAAGRFGIGMALQRQPWLVCAGTWATNMRRQACAVAPQRKGSTVAGAGNTLVVRAARPQGSWAPVCAIPCFFALYFIAASAAPASAGGLFNPETACTPANTVQAGA